MIRKSARIKALSLLKKGVTEMDEDEQKYEDNAVAKNVADNWTDSETAILLHQIKQQLVNDKKHIPCCKRIQLLEWKRVKVGNKSPNQCIEFIKKMIADIPRYRPLGQVLEVYINQRFDKGVVQNTPETANDTKNARVATHGPIKRRQKPDECGVPAPKKANPGLRKKRDRKRIEPKQKPMEASNLIKSEHEKKTKRIMRKRRRKNALEFDDDNDEND